MQRRFPSQSLLGSTLIICGVTACTTDHSVPTVPASRDEPRPVQQGAQRTKVNEGPPWLPVPPDESYGGRSLAAWGIEWARWSNAPTDCENPGQDEDGSMCGLYQDPDSPVFILQLGLGQSLRSRCVVPPNKAVLVPLFGVVLDKLGIWPPADTSEDALKRIVQESMESARDLVLRADDQPIDNLKRWSVGVIEFDYTLPPEPNLYSCSGFDGYTGKVSPAYLGGIFAVFPPPAPGTHTLDYGAMITLDGDDIANYVTTTFHVASD